MKKFFAVIGCGVIGFGIVSFFALLPEPLIAVVVGLSLVLAGCLMFTVSDLLARVSRLEKQLGMPSVPHPSNPDLPQKTCAACGKQYDFDFPKCPWCGCENNSEQMR